MITNKNELPITLKVEHLQQIMEIGRRQAYEILKDPPFHVNKLGGRGIIRIPRDPFFEWYEGRQLKQG